ncbi:MAG TPA: dicarboxylate/amino acid:cation symporter [Gemmatimonadaceae bacterium]|nr:dicarboxylate/amino acid:cation symporter [Gemmatimonadaceae bacterium]
MSALRVLAALVAGVLLGVLAASSGDATIARIIDGVGIIGTLWINAIRMTVIPLVAALTLTSVASIGDPRKVGRLGGTAGLVFLSLLLVSGVFAMLVTPFSFDMMSLTPEAAQNIREGYARTAAAGVTPQAMPSLVQRIIDMVPTNPIRAAADTAILPLVVFSLALGLALTQIAEDRREAVLGVARAVGDAMLTLVGWILKFAPVAVFVLALVLGLHGGTESAAALVHYMVTLSTVLFAFTLVMYPIASVFGGVSPVVFAMGVLPAQAVAVSTRSSLAALPALIAGARDKLKLPASATGFVLPLGVSVFRLNVPAAWVVGVLFLSKLYDVPVTTGMLASLVVTATLLSFSVPGIPSASLLLISPVLAQNGFPPEAVAILIALDAIPDMFKTTANVTGHMTSAVIAARVERAAPPANA